MKKIFNIEHKNAFNLGKHSNILNKEYFKQPLTFML